MDRQWGDLFQLAKIKLKPEVASDGATVSVVNQWAVLSYLFAQSQDFCPASKNIQKQLGVSKDTCRRTIDVLQNLGLVTRDDCLNVVFDALRGWATHSHSSPQGNDDSFALKQKARTHHASYQDAPFALEDALCVQEDAPFAPKREQEKTKKRERETSARKSVDPYLLEICHWWNQLHAEGLVLSRVETDPPSKAVLRAWNNLTFDKKQLARFQDLDALKAAIQASYLGTDRGAWFRLPNLLGANGRGELVAEKILAGAYRPFESQPRPSRVNMGPGVAYDPTTKGKSKWYR